MKHRREGACSECAQRKRKCDQQKPRCSECVKHDRNCVLKTFKVWGGHVSFVNTRHTSRVKATRGKGKRLPNLPSDSTAVGSLDDAAPQSTVQTSGEVTTTFADSGTAENLIQSLLDESPNLTSELPNEADIGNVFGSQPAGLEVSEGSIVPQMCVTYPEDRQVEHFYGNSSVIAVPPLIQYGHVSFPYPVSLTTSQEQTLLWGHFVMHVTKWFLSCGPNDLSTGAEFQDPYSIFLPKLAMESSTLRLAALALSASQYTGCSSSNNSMEQVALCLGFEAYQNIVARKFSSSDDRRQVLILVAAAAFLLLLDPTTYSGVLSISREAAVYVTVTRHLSADQDDIGLSAILQLFRWVDICAQCSLIRFVPLSKPYIHDLLDLHEWELNISITGDANKGVIHPIWSFSRRYINPLMKMARLIRMRHNGGGFVEDPTDGGPTGVQVEELEQMLLDAREADSEEMAAEHMGYSADLLHLNEAICSAIELLLYTRLKSVPWSTAFVRRQVKVIHENLSHVPPDKPTSLGVIFPLYCAGLEAVDLEAREAIIARLRCLPGYWSFREDRLVASLQHVWDIRDQSPGDPWTIWAHKVCNNIADCVPV